MTKESVVSKNVKTTLSALEADGACLWWERLNSGKVPTAFGTYLHLCRPGTADFIAILPVDYGLMIYFIETKADNGKQSLKQKEFQKEVESWGAIYELITDASQVRSTVEKITGFYQRKIDEIIF